jgi:hypothetical protein
MPCRAVAPRAGLPQCGSPTRGAAVPQHRVILYYALRCLLRRTPRTHPLPEAGPFGNPTRECGVAPTVTDTASVVARGNVRRAPTGSWRRAMSAGDGYHAE